MISYEAIIQQIEKHVIQAKQGSSEAILREQLTAIQALCEVALQTTDKKVDVPSVQSIAVTTAVPSATRLEEQDANGESLFDF